MTSGPMTEIVIEVEGRPPTKSEAESLLAAGHPKAFMVMTSVAIADDLTALPRRRVRV